MLLEGQVALSSPHPFPWLQDDSTGHSKRGAMPLSRASRSASHAGGMCPSAPLPRGLTTSCASPPGSCHLQPPLLPAELPPHCFTRASWTHRHCSFLTDPRLRSQHPWTVLQTQGQPLYLPTSSVPYPTLSSLPYHKPHSTSFPLLTTCFPCTHLSLVNPPSRSQSKLYLLL